MPEYDEQAAELIELALLLRPEGELLDLSDLDLSTEDISYLKNRLSSMRKACDIVNGALVRYWNTVHHGKAFVDAHMMYYLGKSKGKEIIDEDVFYEWLTTLSAAKLKRLFTASNIKVTGMTPEERSTFLDETERVGNLSVKTKPM